MFDQAQDVPGRAEVPIETLAWTLSQSLDHLLLAQGTFPLDVVQARYPGVTGPWPTVPATGMDPRWTSPMGQAVQHTLMAWAMTTTPAAGHRLLVASLTAGQAPAAWTQDWAVIQDPSLAVRHGASLHAPWRTAYPLHLAQRECWSLVVEMDERGWLDVPERWDTVPVHGVDGTNAAGIVKHDDLAAIAVRQALADAAAAPVEPDSPCWTVIDRMIHDALAQRPDAVRCLNRLRPTLMDRLSNAPEDWASPAHRQRLRAQLIQSEQQQLRAVGGTGTPSLSVSRARL